MMQRTLSLAVFGLALGMFVATASAAGKAAKKGEASSHTGTVVSAGAGNLVMTGKDNKEHSHEVAATTKITIDGKPAKLEDLKKGMTITVTTDKDGKVTAISSGAAKGPVKAKAAKASHAAPKKVAKSLK